jgi:acyl-CoA synthetase (AMP-forming)/AMP-acid ligase II
MQLESFLERNADRHAEKTAVVCGPQRLSFAEVEQAANRLARAFMARGVNRGDRVGVHLENSVEALIAIFAVLKVGGVFVMVNPSTKTDKLTYVLNDCRATALCLPATKLATHASCWQQTPHLRTLVVTGTAATPLTVPGKKCVGWSDAQEEQAGHDQPPAKRAIDIDLAALVYTSGSTGNPKGVMLSHQNMVAAATSITTYLENRSDDILLSVLPLAFDYGLYQALMSIKFGGTLILERSFAYPQAIFKRLAEEHVTGFPLVPTMLAVALQMDLSKHDLSTLRYVTNTREDVFHVWADRMQTRGLLVPRRNRQSSSFGWQTDAQLRSPDRRRKWADRRAGRDRRTGGARRQRDARLLGAAGRDGANTQTRRAAR